MDDKKIQSEVFQALGAASMCWNPLPKDNVFDSNRALGIGENLLEKIHEYASNAKQLPRNYFSNLWNQLGRWGAETFVGSTAVTHSLKLMNEAEELHYASGTSRSETLAEMADCLIALINVGFASNITPLDLLDAVEQKHSVNSRRTWVRQPDGTYQHTEQPVGEAGVAKSAEQPSAGPMAKLGGSQRNRAVLELIDSQPVKPEFEGEPILRTKAIKYTQGVVAWINDNYDNLREFNIVHNGDLHIVFYYTHNNQAIL